MTSWTVQSMEEGKVLTMMSRANQPIYLSAQDVSLVKSNEFEMVIDELIDCLPPDENSLKSFTDKVLNYEFLTVHSHFTDTEKELLHKKLEVIKTELLTQYASRNIN